jgi:hypothetical protein
VKGLGKAFAYLIAAHVQAVGMVVFAWWLGIWLNEKAGGGFNWLIVTIPLGVAAMAHSFYLIIRNLIWQKKAAEEKKGEDSEVV